MVVEVEDCKRTSGAVLGGRRVGVIGKEVALFLLLCNPNRDGKKEHWQPDE